MQASLMANTPNNSMNGLAEVLGEQVISQGLWPAHSTDLNPCDFYLWSILKIKCM
jgi:hypothetical protein